MLLANSYDFEADMHLFQYQELKILLDVNSGAIHVLDDLSYLLVDRLRECHGDIDQAIAELRGQAGEEELLEVAAELAAASQAGALFSQAEAMSYDFSGLPVKALCLNVAHACNMRCRYCFASQGDFGMKPSLMPLQIGQQALDFLIAASGPVKNIEVDFFGGEPLLNAAMIQDLVAYARQRETECGKHFNFTLTTNALLLDEEIIDFVINNDIAVILSLDGRPATNDRHRILNSGVGSYELIVPKIKAMVDRKPVSYYVRGTFTRHNMNFARDLEHLLELGFDSLSLEPAVGPNNGYSIQAEDLPEVLAEYERLTELLRQYRQKGQQVHFFHYDLDLQKGPCLAKRQSGCGAGVEYLTVTPEGDVYPCHQLVGEEQFIMGNLAYLVLDQKVKSRFASNRLGDKAICRACWARNFCGGGCHANAFHANGDMSQPDQVSCAMHRKRIEGAIYLEMLKSMAG